MLRSKLYGVFRTEIAEQSPRPSLSGAETSSTQRRNQKNSNFFSFRQPQSSSLVQVTEYGVLFPFCFCNLLPTRLLSCLDCSDCPRAEMPLFSNPSSLDDPPMPRSFNGVCL